jgi:hypothetical protein
MQKEQKKSRQKKQCDNKQSFDIHIAINSLYDSQPFFESGDFNSCKIMQNSDISEVCYLLEAVLYIAFGIIPTKCYSSTLDADKRMCTKQFVYSEFINNAIDYIAKHVVHEDVYLCTEIEYGIEHHNGCDVFIGLEQIKHLTSCFFQKGCIEAQDTEEYLSKCKFADEREKFTQAILIKSAGNIIMDFLTSHLKSATKVLLSALISGDVHAYGMGDVATQDITHNEWLMYDDLDAESVKHQAIQIPKSVWCENQPMLTQDINTKFKNVVIDFKELCMMMDGHFSIENLLSQGSRNHNMKRVEMDCVIWNNQIFVKNINPVYTAVQHGQHAKKGRDEKYIKCGDIVIQFAKQYEKDKKYKSRHELSKDVAKNIEEEYRRIQKLAKNQRSSKDRYFLNVMSTFEALVNSVHNAWRNGYTPCYL